MEKKKEEVPAETSTSSPVAQKRSAPEKPVETSSPSHKLGQNSPSRRGDTPTHSRTILPVAPVAKEEPEDLPVVVESKGSASVLIPIRIEEGKEDNVGPSEAKKLRGEEETYELANLPCAELYERSYQHKEVLQGCIKQSKSCE